MRAKIGFAGFSLQDPRVETPWPELGVTIPRDGAATVFLVLKATLPDHSGAHEVKAVVTDADGSSVVFSLNGDIIDNYEFSTFRELRLRLPGSVHFALKIDNETIATGTIAVGYQ